MVRKIASSLGRKSERSGKRKRLCHEKAKSLTWLEETGAGEGIRTLDPNLGKVVLYP